MKTIILYYSRTRRTAKVAKTLAEELGADSIEITDVKERKGLINYVKSSIDAFRNNKTNIKPEEFDLTGYDLVYIGTPTWGGKPTPAIITMINKCDLKDKDVILFTTMGRSGKNTINWMKEKIEGKGGIIVDFFTLKTSKITNKKELDNIGKETIRIIDEMDIKK